MLEHKCKDCRWVWRDNEDGTCCDFCWEGDYTTEPVEVEEDETSPD